MVFRLRNSIRGFMDGLLTIMGVVVGVQATGSTQFLLVTGLSVAAASFMANTAGAWVSEESDLHIKAFRKERLLGYKPGHLRKGKYLKKLALESKTKALNDGVGTLLAAFLLLAPHAFLDPGTAFVVSVAFFLTALAVTGRYIGEISVHGSFEMAAKTLAIGVVTFALCTIVTMLVTT